MHITYCPAYCLNIDGTVWVNMCTKFGADSSSHFPVRVLKNRQTNRRDWTPYPRRHTQHNNASYLKVCDKPVSTRPNVTRLKQPATAQNWLRLLLHQCRHQAQTHTRLTAWSTRVCKTRTQLLVLRGGSAVGRWTCDLQVAGSIPGRWLSRNIHQLSLASLRGRYIEYLLRQGVKAGFSPLSGGR